MIYDSLLYLPEELYRDEEVGLKTANVYQHIYSSYYGGGNSVCGEWGKTNLYRLSLLSR